jgi:outer membrane protein assembly factor BamB
MLEIRMENLVMDRRKFGKWVAMGAGLALVISGVVGFRKLDLERFHGDAAQIRKLAAAALPPLNPQPLASGDWPQWRGPRRDGVAQSGELSWQWPADGPPKAWQKPSGRGFSSLAIARGRLYTMAEELTAGADQVPAQETVICWDAASGRELWCFRYPNRFDERFGSGPRATPMVDGAFVYTLGPTGILHCLDAETGAKVWRHDLSDEFQAPSLQYGVACSPLVEGGLVIVTPGGPNGHAVIAFDKRTGAVVWTALDDSPGYSSPITATLAGVRQILCFTNVALVSLAPEDGRVYWRYPWLTEHGFNIATPLVIGDYVFISSAYGKGCALLEIAAGADGGLQPTLVYEHNRMRNYFASSVRWGDYIYGLDMTDLVCLEIRTGRVVWREKGQRSFKKGSLLAADGHLIIQGESGQVFLVEATPAGYREKAAFTMSTNKCWTVPALADGRLYVRDEGQISCFDLRRR